MAPEKLLVSLVWKGMKYKCKECVLSLFLEIFFSSHTMKFRAGIIYVANSSNSKR